MTELPKELQEAMDDLCDLGDADLLDIVDAQNQQIEAMQKREEVLVKMVKDEIAKCIINIPRFDEEGDRESAVYNETRLELLEEIIKSIKE